MNCDLLKNPLIIGLVLGVVTYLYLMWTNNKKDNKKKKPGLITPIIVAVLACIIASIYFDEKKGIEYLGGGSKNSNFELFHHVKPGISLSNELL